MGARISNGCSYFDKKRWAALPLDPHYLPVRLKFPNSMSNTAIIAGGGMGGEENLLHLKSAALNSAENAVVITDRRGTIVWVNPSFTRVTGYSAAEALGKNPRILQSGHHDREFYRKLWETILAGETWRGEFVNRRKDGTIFYDEHTITPVRSEGGQITHFIGVLNDVTERRRLEEELRQIQKMEAIGHLAGGIAHDFNNILAAVMMNVSLLQGRDDLPADVKEYLVELEGEMKRATGLTRQLLLFSRRQPADVREIDLNAVIKDLSKMLTRLFGDDTQLSIQLATGPLWLKADLGMMEQVVMNLCLNAREAMAQGGRALLQTDLVNFSPESLPPRSGARPGNFVRLCVSDTGCGMDEETLKRAFEPFFTTKEVGKGTGLGLAAVYGIVKQHCGWVEASSALDKGTTFRVYFPVVTPPAAPRLPDGVEGGSETILLVEDEVALRRTAALWLRKLGYAVLEAGSGPEALEVWTRQGDGVDLVLTDVVMPGGMTGVELVERLRADRPGLPALLVSGYSTEYPQLESSLQKPTRYLAKPYRPSILAKVVRECFGSGKEK